MEQGPRRTAPPSTALMATSLWHRMSPGAVLTREQFREVIVARQEQRAVRQEVGGREQRVRVQCGGI